MKILSGRLFAKAAAVIALAVPAGTGLVTAHAANGAVDQAVIGAGLCDFEGVLPDASGICAYSLPWPFTTTGVGNTSGSGWVLEPAGDVVNLSYAVQSVAFLPQCMGCPGTGTAVLVGTANDEGVVCPFVGDVTLAGGATVVITAATLTWEGC